MKIRSILGPVDFSESSQAALKAAAEIARDGNAQLTRVHVCAPPMLYPEAPFMLSDIAQLAAAAEQGIAECKRSAMEWGAPRVNTRVAQGVPWDRIVHMAKDEGFDLIVIGTHGRTGLRTRCWDPWPRRWCAMRPARSGGPRRMPRCMPLWLEHRLEATGDSDLPCPVALIGDLELAYLAVFAGSDRDAQPDRQFFVPPVELNCLCFKADVGALGPVAYRPGARSDRLAAVQVTEVNPYAVRIGDRIGLPSGDRQIAPP